MNISFEQRDIVRRALTLLKNQTAVALEWQNSMVETARELNLEGSILILEQNRYERILFDERQINILMEELNDGK